MANQMTNAGFVYDANGNLTSDGTYTWDRANRLKSLGTTTYSYDGLGNRVQQTVSNTVTNYLLNLQPGLTKVLAATTGTNTDHYIHSVRGIHAQSDGTHWQYITQDGLGSVRGLINATLGVDAVQSYNPMGVPDGSYGTGYGFTGEQTDGNSQVYLRARYYNPSMGVFTALDPFEGTMQRPMSLNSYSWVEGNFPNATDPSGNIPLYDDVESGRTLYSCKCGWIDFGHALPWKALAVIDAINYPIDWNSHPDVLPDIRVIRLRDYANAVVTDLLSTDSYYINDRRIESWYDVRGVALGIFKNHEEHFEGTQSILNPLNPIAGLIGKGASGFAEEDLPSDLIGFWYAYTFENAEAVDGYNHPHFRSAIDDLCDVMTIEESLQMFEEYENNGGFELGWENWYRRPRPAGTQLARPCQTETWPSVLENLYEIPGSVVNRVPNFKNQWGREYMYNHTWQSIYYESGLKDLVVPAGFRPSLDFLEDRVLLYLLSTKEDDC